MKTLSLVLTLPVIFFQVLYGQDVRRGTVKGSAIDAESREPLIGVNVLIQGTQFGAATDLEGNFEISQVPVGSYALLVSYVGYESNVKTDVIVRSQRITFVQAELRQSAIESEAVVVRADYFDDALNQPVSVVGLSGEEIRRAPGSAGDVSRIVFGLPAVAKIDDTMNSLVVRGGGPTENGFYVDNIEIPNINHFPQQGSSGGPIGIINVDFIGGVDFHTGGFSTVYGDRLSSVMDIRFRRGNPDENDVQLDLNLAGVGGIVEGPLPGRRGSFMISARRSFLDFIVGAIEEDETSVPQYADIQAKLAFDLSPRHKMSVLEILSVDEINLSAENAIDNGENLYSDFKCKTNTVGVNWQYLWSSKGHSTTSIAHTWSAYDFQAFETRYFRDNDSEKILLDLKPEESELKLRNLNYVRFNDVHASDFGVEVKVLSAENNNLYGSYNDALGAPIEEFRVDDTVDAAKLSGFVSHAISPTGRITVTPGLRIDHFTYNENTTLSPRLSLNYRATSRLSFNAAAGIFHQNLPLPLLEQNASNKGLRTPVAYHFIVGIERLLRPDTRLTVEIYDKEYDRFPLDPIQPQLFIIDQVVQAGLYFNPNPLVDTGRAYTRGIEFLLQRKLAGKVYGMVSAAYFRSRYRDADGIWRNRSFDNRVTFQAEGGYKPNSRWEYSIRWLFGGGRPYTPFDEAASMEALRGILDTDNVNSERLPPYHALNLRLDRRFHFRRTNLIAYVSIWNVYGRTNVSRYQWNEISNEVEALEQWGLLPIFGLELEL